MNHLFISYSRRDSEFVGAVTEKLRQLGYEVWQDVSGKSSGIPFSTKWFAAIEEALYASAGAVVFRSGYWEKSVPCRKEYDIVKDLAIPCFEVKFPQDDADALTEQIMEWADSAVYGDEKNELRTWMMSSVNAQRARRSRNAGIPHYRKIKESRAFLRRLDSCGELAEELCLKENSPSLYSDIQNFIKKARRITIWDRVRGPLVLIIITGFLITIFSYTENHRHEKARLEPEILAMNRLSSFKETYSDDELALLVALMTDEYDYGENSGYFFETAAEALDTVFPSGFFRNGSAEVEAVKAIPPQNESEGELYRPSEDSAIFCVSFTDIDEAGLTLHLTSVPEHYAVKDGRLAISCGSRVFLLDTERGWDTVELNYCYRKISDIRIDGQGRICAVTEAGDVYVWDDPYSSLICDAPSGIRQMLSEEFVTSDGMLSVKADPTGAMKVTDTESGHIVWQCSTVREPLKAVCIDEENGLVYAEGVSGTFYRADASPILRGYDPEPVGLGTRYLTEVMRLNDLLVKELGVAKNWLPEY